MNFVCSLDCFIPCGPSAVRDSLVENRRQEIVSSNLKNLRKSESKTDLCSPDLTFQSTDTSKKDEVEVMNPKEIGTKNTLGNSIVEMGVEKVDGPPNINQNKERKNLKDEHEKRLKEELSQYFIIQNQRRETLKAEHQERFEEQLRKFQEQSPDEKKDDILQRLISILCLRNQSECFGKNTPDEISLSLKEDAKKEFDQLKKFYNSLKKTEKNDLDRFICSKYKKEINTAASILKRYTDIGIEIKDPEDKHEAKNNEVKGHVDRLKNEKVALRGLAKELI